MCGCQGATPTIGTSTGTAWQTITKVNGSTFSAAIPSITGACLVRDIAYGSIERQQRLPITFGRLWHGANPIIKGSTLLNVAGYVLATNTQTRSSDVRMRDEYRRWGDADWRDQFPSARSAPGRENYIALQAGPGMVKITAAHRSGPRPAPNTSAITRITWEVGQQRNNRCCWHHEVLGCDLHTWTTPSPRS